MYTSRPIWSMILWLGMALSLPATAQTLSGVVFRDYDGDGARDTYEDGVADIDVSVYDSGATLVGSGTTLDDGTYSLALSVGAGTNVRVTFSNIPGYLQPAPLGADNRGTVVFAQSGDTDVDLGLHNPGEHCQASPGLASTCFIYGEQSTSSADALVTYTYTAGNNGVSNTPSDYDSPAHGIEAVANEIGSTFGLTYHGASNSLFVAAYMKRHSGFGPDGVGAIYRVDRDSSTVSLFADLDALFPGAAGSDPHPFGTNFDIDGASWDAVGKLALGGMDLSDDQQTLYVMNLADRQLYALPIGLTPTAPNAGDIDRFAVPTPAGCVASDVRPFAVRVHDGMVYVGVICSAESTGLTSDLDAVVYRFDPSDSSWTQVLRFDLDYARGCANSGTSATCNTSGSGDYQPAGWRAWRNAFDATVLTQTKGFFNTVVYAQPILTDLDFARGHMIIGLRDRLGDQTGAQTQHPTSGAATRYIGISAGDLLIAKADGMGGFTLESNGSVDSVAGGGVGNSQGPGGGEFFAGEFYRLTSVDHTETTLGGLAFAPGTAEILSNVFDPVINTSLPNNTTYDAGTHWYSLANGGMNRAYRVYNGPVPAGAPTGPNGELFGKANGLGDLEPLCEAPTTQVGNRVWQDIDGDGIQDAGEPGIAGVTVTLDCGSGTTSTITDSDGVFVFTVPNGTSCDLTIDTSDSGIIGLLLTSADEGADDTLDSDAVASPTQFVISFTAGGLGENDHSLDFGFAAPAILGDFIWHDVNGDGLQAGEGGNGFNNVTVDLIEDTNGNGTADVGEPVHDTTATDASGFYSFTDLPAGDYIVSVTDTNNVLTGYSATTTEPLAVTLSAGDEYADADFGYQLPPPGSIGDFVWSDDNGDGVQDGGELGFANVTLDLIEDTNGNGMIDGGEPVLDTTSTDASGIYLFSELSAGDYIVNVTDTNNVVIGLALTGGVNPHAVTLSTSQEYVEADFGYTHLASSSIGDTVYLDDNNNGSQDVGEPGIDGVTLDLIRDLDGDGVLDGGEPVLQTDTTAGGGLYLFESLPPGDYLVQVTDTGNLLTAYTLSGGTNPHAVTDLLDDSEYLDADFGYYIDRPVIGVAKRATLKNNHVTYTFVIENLGNVALSNPSLTDNLNNVFGAGLWALTAVPTFIVDPGTFSLRADYNGTSQTQLIQAGGTLAAGAIAEFSIELVVYALSDQGHGNGIYHNQVTVTAQPPGGGKVTDISDDGSDPDPDGNGNPAGQNESDPTIVILTEVPQLTATKADAIFDDTNKNGELDPGEQVIYTVVISNIGDAIAEDVIFESGVDPNTDFVVGSVTTTQGTVTTGNTDGGPVVVVELGSMPGDTSATITFRATVHDPLPGGVTQIACQGFVNSNNTPPDLETDDPDTGKPDDPTVTPLGGSPIIEATKADSLFNDLDNDGNLDPGETLLYTVVITNTGNRPATEVVFDSGVDPKTTLVVGSVTTTAGTVTTGNTGGDTTVQVEIGTIAVSGTVTVTFQVHVTEPWPPGETEIACQGTVSGGNFPDEPTDDPDTVDDDDPTVTPVEITPVVTITKTSELWVDVNGDGVLNPGDTLRYTIIVHNEGPVTALAAVVTDDPDPNTTLVVGSVDTTVGSVTEGNNPGDTTVEVVLGDMAVDATETIHFQVLVTPAPGANLIYNQAFVEGDNFEQVGSDNPNTVTEGDPTEDVVVYAVPTLGETALLLLILSMAATAIYLRRQRG